MVQGGVMGETSYPYQGVKSQCKYISGSAKVSLANCVKFKPTSEEELKDILFQEGPVSIRKYSMNIFSIKYLWL
jgi:hypothetical protein